MEKAPRLSLKEITLSINDALLLDRLSFSIGAGEIHAIVGRNGAGKSTLVHCLAGHPLYVPSKGSISLDGSDLGALSPEERAALGLFVAFQDPPAIPGLQNLVFLKKSVESVRAAQKKAPLSPKAWLSLLKEGMEAVQLPFSFLGRSLNEDFSGGEKKRNEMLQMHLLKPSFIVMDEMDSGLDADALGLLVKSIERLRSPHRSFLIITHYTEILEALLPDRIHWMEGGKIIKSGGIELAQSIRKSGYPTA